MAVNPLDFEPLVVSVATRHRGRGLDHDDLVQEGWIGLLKACRRPLRDPATFPAYARCCVRGAILEALTRHWRFTPASDVLELVEPPSPPAREPAAELLAGLTRRQAAVLDLRLGLSGERCTVRETAARLGIGTTTTYLHERRALKRLKQLWVVHAS